MYSHLLVPLDGDDRTQAALHPSAAMARSFDATLILVGCAAALASLDVDTIYAPDVVAVRTEVDLRGFRVDEVNQELMRSIDEAILSDLTELRIIHGKGTGAVRARVTALLEDDGRVSTFRVGGRAEGGAGVTVARFR